MIDHGLNAQCEGLHREAPPESCVLVIFGASGDLTWRALMPALLELERYGLLPERCAIIGFSNAAWGDEEFRTTMAQKNRDLRKTGFDEELWKRFAPRLHYLQGDFTSPPDGDYARLAKAIAALRAEKNIADNLLFHLATPPKFFGTIAERLAAAGLARRSDGHTGAKPTAGAAARGDDKPGWRRLVIEKPFGVDAASCDALNRTLSKAFSEDQLFRIDHFLGKETVQNMLVLRFANPSFEPVWNRNFIDHVQITVAENIGIGTRAAFYENTGVVRDMVQNHLLQLLCMTALEPPQRFEGGALRDETEKVLSAVCNVDVTTDCVAGQYAPGTVGGVSVPGYLEENDVRPDSKTATYAAVRLMIDNWRWAGVPFYLRTGKRMSARLTEVAIQFKPTPHLMFPVARRQLAASTLVFGLQPHEGIVHHFLAKQPGPGLKLTSVDMSFRYATAFGMTDLPPAYAWLLLDAMQGDPTLFARADWIRSAWEIVDPIVSAWENRKREGLAPPRYAAGTDGPKEADALMAADGRAWRPIVRVAKPLAKGGLS